MDRLSVHFDWSEFRCRGNKCCGNVSPVRLELVEALEELRILLNHGDAECGVKLHVDSGFRCRVHNAEVGGVIDSTHLYGMAADIRPEGCSVLRLASMARNVRAFAMGGIGVYDGFVHLDVRRNGPAHW